MQNSKNIAELIADALSNAAQTIYDGISDITDKQPEQGAGATDTAEATPEVVAAAVDVVEAAKEVDAAHVAIDDAYKAADTAQDDYNERLKRALEILKGGK